MNGFAKLPMRFMRNSMLLLALAGLSLVTGCATQRVELDEKPFSDARLFVTRAGSDVTLAWDTRPDLAYTVLYNHTRSAKSPWKILKGLDRIRGTGRRVTYHDEVPVNAQRYYRLHAYPAVGFAD